MGLWPSALENMEIKNILVTGSEGYIGTILVDLLIKKGYQVTGLDSCYYSNNRNLKKNYRLLKKDIRKIDDLDLTCFDAIIHLAALSNDPTGELNPKLTKEINYLASIKLAKRAKKSGVKRFIFSSSCSIYGIAKTGIVNENSPVNPLTAYAKSKISTEKELNKLADKNFCVAILRNSTVFGSSPNFRIDLVVNNLVASGIALKKIKIMSDGTPWRPLIDVRDLSQIFIKFLRVESKKINKKIFNIGFSQSNLRVKDIADEIKKQLPDCQIVFTGEHGPDTKSYHVNFNRFHLLFPKLKQNWLLSKSVKDLIRRLKNKKFNQQQFQSGKFTRIDVLKNLLDKKKLNSRLYWK